MSDQTKCECGCCDVPDHGACNDYTLGGNGRCVYCDHARECHARYATPSKNKYTRRGKEDRKRGRV